MSAWSYMPLQDVHSHYEYPEDFEYGLGDDDDDIFDQAWASMLTRNMPVVFFTGYVDNDELERLGAILHRARMPEARYEGKNIEMHMLHLLENDCEAIFATKSSAHIVAMMFGGTVVER